MLKRLKKEKDSTETTSGKAKEQTNLLRLLILIALTIAVLVVYRFFLDHRLFLAVMIVYMVIFVAFLVVYLIYNRGFSRRNVTAEMLPDTWSEEQKKEFIEDGRRRLSRSRWMLFPLFALGFTFAYDAIELFVVPYVQNLFFK